MKVVLIQKCDQCIEFLLQCKNFIFDEELGHIPGSGCTKLEADDEIITLLLLKVKEKRLKNV